MFLNLFQEFRTTALRLQSYWAIFILYLLKIVSFKDFKIGNFKFTGWKGEEE